MTLDERFDRIEEKIQDVENLIRQGVQVRIERSVSVRLWSALALSLLAIGLALFS